MKGRPLNRDKNELWSLFKLKRRYDAFKGMCNKLIFFDQIYPFGIRTKTSSNLFSSYFDANFAATSSIWSHKLSNNLWHHINLCQVYFWSAFVCIGPLVVQLGISIVILQSNVKLDQIWWERCCWSNSDHLAPLAKALLHSQRFSMETPCSLWQFISIFNNIKNCLVPSLPILGPGYMGKLRRFGTERLPKRRS